MPLLERLTPYGTSVLLGNRLYNITLLQDTLGLYIYVGTERIDETWPEQLQNSTIDMYIGMATESILMGALNVYSLDRYWNDVVVDILNIGRLYFNENDVEPWSTSFLGEPTYTISKDYIDSLVDSMMLTFRYSQLESQPLSTTLTESGFAPYSKYMAWIMAGDFDSDITFYNIPDIIYTTTAEENGLGGTFMYGRGILEEFVPTGELYSAVIRTNVGELMLGLPQEIFDFLVEENLLTPPTELDLLELDQEFGFFFRYTGFSNLFNVPAGIFVGSN